MAADPGLAEYLAALEQALTRRLGREHVLSPPDFRLAREWYAAGLPLATLLAGIDAAFAAGFGPRSLQACRRFVERGARADRARAAEPVAPGAGAGPWLALAGRLEALGSPFAAWAAEARALAAAPEAEGAPRREALARDLTAAARAALAPLDEQAARREAERALRRQPGLPEGERVAALERHLERRALERLGLLGLL